jgi:adenosylhomocysteine nucleosidase
VTGELNTRVFGVIAALPAEATSCRLPAAQWALLCSGAGPEAALRSAQQLLLERGVAGLISWGTAGALAPHLKTGSLVLYGRCVDAASGESFATDPALRAQLYTCLRALHPVSGDGLTSQYPVSDRAHKQALGAEFSCVAVDMESAAIAALAHAHQVPFIAIRAIVDPAHCTLPRSALAALEDPTHAVTRVMRALIRRPWELGALLKLAWWYGRALRQLRAAAALMASADWANHKIAGA